MFLQTIAEEDATGRVAEIYKTQKSQLGFVMAAAKCLSARPDLLPAYTDFSDKVRSGFSLGQREWRLITLIAAKHVPSTYCSYVYGKQLIGDLGSKEAVIAVQRDFRTAGLSDRTSRCWPTLRRSRRTHPRLLRPTSTGCDQSDSWISKSVISHLALHLDALSVGSSTQWAPVRRPPSSIATRTFER